MKVVFQNCFIDVFFIYWAGGKVFFLGLPAGHGGLIYCDSSQVEVVGADWQVDWYFVSLIRLRASIIGR